MFRNALPVAVESVASPAVFENDLQSLRSHNLEEWRARSWSKRAAEMTLLLIRAQFQRSGRNQRALVPGAMRDWTVEFGNRRANAPSPTTATAVKPGSE